MMRIEMSLRRLLPAMVLGLVLAACGADPGREHGHSHDDAGHGGGHAAHAADAPRGPHGGRLLESGDFRLEVTVFERGVPPEFRLYVWHRGEPVDPATVQAQVELRRLGGRRDVFDFRPVEDYLRGDGEVAEPHSFDVRVTAQAGGETHEWSYASHEGRVRIAAGLAEEAGITTATAGPGEVRETLRLYGRLHPDPARVAGLRARFPGLITRLDVQLGQRVERGQQLATVESDDSLRPYALRAPIGGEVIDLAANAGEVAGADALLRIADHSRLWALLVVHPRQAAQVATGQAVTLRADGLQASGEIDHVAPTDAARPARHARVVVDNSSGRWTPGMAVTGGVEVSRVQAPLVVDNRALQRWRDFTVVFARFGETYEVRMLDTGRSDGRVTEVLGGLEPGTEYVVGNSYLIKADIEKSGASHDH